MIKVVKVSGDSMSPYLMSSDHVYVDQSPPQYGDLVLIKKKKSDDFIVHRFLGENNFKGDRVKDYDQNIWGDLDLCGRIYAIESRKGILTFKNDFYQTIHKIQASLSGLNIYQNKIIGKLCVVLLIIIGKTSRILQGRK